MALAEYSTRNNWALQDVPVSWIVGSHLNPRKRFDEAALQELADSIREHGLLEPLVVREITTGALEYHGRRNVDPGACYEIVAGERRWRACKLAGVETVPVRILEDIDDAKALQLALVENLQRKDLDPIEEAEGYAQLNRVAGMRQAEIAAAVNRSQPAVAKAMSLLDLPEDVRERIRNGELSVAHGVAIARYKAFPAVASKLAKVAVADRLTSHQLEKPGVISDYGYKLHDVVQRISEYNPPFDISICKKCPFGAYRKGTYDAYCLKPEHYAELEQEAREHRKQLLEEQRRAAEAETGSSLPLVEALGEVRYIINSTPPTGCGEQCECRVKALDRYGAVVQVCTDPDRFDGLADGDNRAVVDARAAAVREAVQRLETRMAGLMVGRQEMALLVSLALQGNSDKAAMKAAAGRHLPDVQLEENDYTYRGAGKLHEKLEKASAVEVLRFGIEAALRYEIKQSSRYNKPDRALWYLGLEATDGV